MIYPYLGSCSILEYSLLGWVILNYVLCFSDFKEKSWWGMKRCRNNKLLKKLGHNKKNKCAKYQVDQTKYGHTFYSILIL